MSAVLAPAPAQPVVLCVDDEPNILSALRRLFRGDGYKVVTAPGGAEGLEALGQLPADVVISDMRMPEMDGAQFLAAVKSRCPAATRILLTGHADMASTIAAINQGQISRYVQKPWNDAELQLVVREALERQALVREKERLEALTRSQNEELKALNAELEARVEKRTAQLREALQRVERANAEVNAAFLTAIKVIAGLVELRDRAFGGHSRRVADLALRIARRMGLDEKSAQEVMLAGLLHGVGRMGLPDALFSKPRGRLTGEELAQVRAQLLGGERILMPLPMLAGVATLIRASHEHFDGSGEPDGMAGLEIPLGARIVAVAVEAQMLASGLASGREMPPAAVEGILVNEGGKRFDPQVVVAACGVLEHLEAQRGAQRPAERSLRTAGLAPGMVLARDLTDGAGRLLLSVDFVLTDGVIRQLRDYEAAERCVLAIAVRP